MNWYKIKHTIRMCLQGAGQKRALYIKKYNILRHIGEHRMVMLPQISLYSKLISMGDNVCSPQELLLFHMMRFTTCLIIVMMEITLGII